MCDKLLRFWLAFLWLCLSVLALQAEEQERWYLISESELRSIETSLERLEADRRSWESQARELRSEAGNLNSQLAGERERYRTLEQYFNRYEREQSMLLSLKNGEVAGLEQKAADETMRADSYKKKMVLAIVGAALMAVVTVFSIVRGFLWK